MMQVWQVGDYYWTVGDFASAAEAMQPVEDATGMDADEITDDGATEIRPCTEAELDRLTFSDDEKGNKISSNISFRERLAQIIASGDTSPDIFACTEE
jgi:hypothetical protein